MKNIILLLALLLITFSSANAQEVSTVPPTDKDLEGDLKFLKSGKSTEEKSFDEDLRIKKYDLEKGLSLDSFSTADDGSRISILYHINSNPMKLAGISGFEFEYAKKFDHAWWEFYFAQTTATFSNIADDNGQFLTSTSTEVDEQNLTTSTLGTGLSYRTSLIQTLFASDNLFETVAAYVNYNKTSTDLGDSYSGFGMKADFGLHYRTSESFHWGGKFSYNLAQVKRAEITENETSSAKSLLLQWTTFAIDLSYYF
ncbi:hypothetical protein A9Q84_09295 [Halobacteriovorax marinus]|uniref:Outer membrane beta-barrel domain-containing protein n=1 Tax=Halobacteriovorax marinus TaxID=97084 RepID=A0A1Y5F6W4_9BACT|nr:hypothetical protein A9Q84_09295 [Halobacteriovorax marinus]